MSGWGWRLSFGCEGLDPLAVVTGECSSAAILPFAACQRRCVTSHATLLFHPDPLAKRGGCPHRGSDRMGAALSGNGEGSRRTAGEVVRLRHRLASSDGHVPDDSSREPNSSKLAWQSRWTSSPWMSGSRLRERGKELASQQVMELPRSWVAGMLSCRDCKSKSISCDPALDGPFLTVAIGPLYSTGTSSRGPSTLLLMLHTMLAHHGSFNVLDRIA